MCTRQVRVARGHTDCLVAHQRLCGLEINAGHNQSGTECMSQIMPSEVRDLRFCYRQLEPGPRIVEWLTKL